VTSEAAEAAVANRRGKRLGRLLFSPLRRHRQTEFRQQETLRPLVSTEPPFRSVDSNTNSIEKQLPLCPELFLPGCVGFRLYTMSQKGFFGIILDDFERNVAEKKTIKLRFISTLCD